MSLEIINVPYELTSNLSALIALIKEKTGLEITPPEDGTLSGKFKMRFPDMENAKNVYLYNRFDQTGTIFIDAANHFLAYAVGAGTGVISNFSALYRGFIFDYNGELGNMCATSNTNWYYTNTSADSDNYIAENDSTKQNITLVPLRVRGTYRNEDNTENMYATTFVKNAYINYERRFQHSLKFIDQNGNKFVTLGGYILYKID